MISNYHSRNYYRLALVLRKDIRSFFLGPEAQTNGTYRIVDSNVTEECPISGRFLKA